MAYARGNLAVKQKSAERGYQPERFRETTKVVTRKTTLPVGEKLLYLLTVLVCVAVMGGLLLQNSGIYNIKRQMYNIDAEISKNNVQIKELSIQKEILEQQIPEKAAELGYILPLEEGLHVTIPN